MHTVTWSAENAVLRTAKSTDPKEVAKAVAGLKKGSYVVYDQSPIWTGTHKAVLSDAVYRVLKDDVLVMTPDEKKDREKLLKNEKK